MKIPVEFVLASVVVEPSVGGAQGSTFALIDREEVVRWCQHDFLINRVHCDDNGSKELIYTIQIAGHWLEKGELCQRK